MPDCDFCKAEFTVTGSALKQRMAIHEIKCLAREKVLGRHPIMIDIDNCEDDTCKYCEARLERSSLAYHLYCCNKRKQAVKEGETVDVRNIPEETAFKAETREALRQINERVDALTKLVASLNYRLDNYRAVTLKVEDFPEELGNNLLELQHDKVIDLRAFPYSSDEEKQIQIKAVIEKVSYLLDPESLSRNTVDDDSIPIGIGCPKAGEIIISMGERKKLGYMFDVKWELFLTREGAVRLREARIKFDSLTA